MAKVAVIGHDMTREDLERVSQLLANEGHDLVTVAARPPDRLAWMRDNEVDWWLDTKAPPAGLDLRTMRDALKAYCVPANESPGIDLEAGTDIEPPPEVPGAPSKPGPPAPARPAPVWVSILPRGPPSTQSAVTAK